MEEIPMQKIRLVPKTKRAEDIVEEYGEIFQRLIDINGVNCIQSIPPEKAWWINTTEAEFVDVQ
jgi:hypothetical protein